MFPNGRYWLPPSLDADAVHREKANVAEKERRQRQQKEDRANRELMTGRQFERRKRRGEFGANNSKLNPEELRRFDRLVRKKMSLSRKTICEAMSFCFDNCVAAREVSALLKEALLDESDRVTNDMRIARLYLLSDILFNSQQPGVRNAFMYRTTIESMAAEVFRDLGGVVRRKERKSGRITVNKLRKAVSAVLGAWVEWGVYNATFVDELEAHFEGREVKVDATDAANGPDANTEKTVEPERSEDADDVVIHGQRGDWKEVSDELNKTKSEQINAASDIVTKHQSEAMIEKSTTSQTVDESQNSTTNIEHSQKDMNNIDSEDLDGEDIDGEDLDGEDLDGEDLDGEELDGEDLDGEIIDGADIDGEDFDGEVLMEEELDDEEIS
jgi:U2-associated protein SR140